MQVFCLSWVSIKTGKMSFYHITFQLKRENGDAHLFLGSVPWLACALRAFRPALSVRRNVEEEPRLPSSRTSQPTASTASGFHMWATGKATTQFSAINGAFRASMYKMSHTQGVTPVGGAMTGQGLEKSGMLGGRKTGERRA